MTTTQFSPLAVPNTLGLPAHAEQGVVITQPEQLVPILTYADERRLAVSVLGSGSNVVLPRKMPGITLLMRIPGIQVIDSDSSYRRFEVGCGVSWQGFVRFCLGQGLGGGIENLTLIPGTVGAAPIQNIGAYGVEVAEFIEAVEVFDRQQHSAGRLWKPATECAFGYRDSCFKRQPERWVVTRIRFRLPTSGRVRTDYAGITDELLRMGVSLTTASATTIAEAVARTRRRKLPDPRRHPNAGSFFKNPLLPKLQYDGLVARSGGQGQSAIEQIPNWPQGPDIKLSAAALIDQTSWKQRPAERVAVWQRQPLVIVNRGGADAADITQFAQAIQQSVEEKFGVLLEQEPQLLG